MRFPRFSFDRLFRPLAAVFTVCLAGAAANYYMDLGWFGQRGRLVLSLAMLAVCFFFMFAQRRSG
jgi:hypothetical protein